VVVTKRAEVSIATDFAPTTNYNDPDKNGMTIYEYLHPDPHTTPIVNPLQVVSCPLNGQLRPGELGWPIYLP